MFKDTKEGQTHSWNDGCGETAHNPMNPLVAKVRPKYWWQWLSPNFWRGARVMESVINSSQFSKELNQEIDKETKKILDRVWRRLIKK